jgi:hypothetical protein
MSKEEPTPPTGIRDKAHDSRETAAQGSTTSTSDSSTHTISAKHLHLCLLHGYCKAGHFPRVGKIALHMSAQLHVQYHITSLITGYACYLTRRGLQEGVSLPIALRAFQKARVHWRSDLGTHDQGDVCRYRQQKWSLALPDMNRV